MLRTSNIWRVGLIMLAIMASLVAGASHLVYASPFSPLVVGGAVAAMAIGVAWLRKPVWALYAAIFVVLLPKGLIPDRIHSILNRSTLLIALGVWLFDAITRRRRIAWTSTALLMLGFLAWGTVTLTWAPNLGLGMDKLVQYASRLAAVLCRPVVGEDRHHHHYRLDSVSLPYADQQRGAKGHSQRHL